MERRQTKHKETILRVFRIHHLLSLADLAKRLPKIDYSTLYRNVHRFLEDGLLKAVTIEATEYYELIHEDGHQHFVCISCKRISPLEIKGQILKKIFPKDFSPMSIEVVARGSCAECAQR